jgi:hypothetical protein
MVDRVDLVYVGFVECPFVNIPLDQKPPLVQIRDVLAAYHGPEEQD